MSMVIPFTKRPLTVRDLEADPGHGVRRKGYFSGVLTCEITLRTPLCIKSLYSDQSVTVPRIPASSLRGMLRNLFEVLGASCARLLPHPPHGLPRGLASCRPEATCITCLLFGYTEEQVSWAGKVAISDATAVPNAWQWTYTNLNRVDHGQPQPAPSWVLFEQVDCDLDLYPTAGHQRTRCAADGSRFRFRIEYVNLTAEEMSVLLFAVTLRYGDMQLCHKLGYAKALGLGECTVAIVEPNPAPTIGTEIELYLNDPVFDAIYKARGL